MKTGLVLEGGACRGIFTTGVLQVMQARGLQFDYCIGVSAGAGNAMHLKSGQLDRAFEIVAGSGPAYYGFSQSRKSGRLVDLDLVYRQMSYSEDMPFDFDAYARSPLVCEYVVTCCETGQAEYFCVPQGNELLLDTVIASCSLPGLCAPVQIGNKRFLDGGIADPMPVRRALAQGCERVVLVTTKPAASLHPTDYRALKHAMSRLYKWRYPAFYQTLMNRIPTYFAQYGRILQMEESGQIFIIRPEECHIHTMEKDRQKMQEYYRHGQAVAQAQWDKLTAYLTP